MSSGRGPRTSYLRLDLALWGGKTSVERDAERLKRQQETRVAVAVGKTAAGETIYEVQRKPRKEKP